MPHNDILAKLKEAVRSVSDNIQNYVSNPGDFSRNGKLPANVLMEFLIGQGSRSTRNELIDAFSYDKDHPSASALVQKRAKLSPAALRDVLYRFNQSLEPSSSNSDYRFFAADGATLSFLSSSIFSSDDLYEENAVNITAVMVCVQIPVSKTKHVYKKSAFPPPSLYAGNMVQWEGRGLFLSRYPI